MNSPRSPRYAPLTSSPLSSPIRTRAPSLPLPPYSPTFQAGRPTGVGNLSVVLRTKRGLLALVTVLIGMAYLVSAASLYQGPSQVVKQLKNSDSPAYQAVLRKVLQHPEDPQDSLAHQLVANERYLMTSYFGGQANQILSMINLLYLAKHTGRVAILPQFTAVHFAGEKRHADYVIDLARLYDDTGIAAVPLSAIKIRRSVSSHPKKDYISCWSFNEVLTGASNDHQVQAGWNSRSIFLSYFAVPPTLSLSTDGYVVKLSSALDFLSNSTWQAKWVSQARREFLPQRPALEGVDVATIEPQNNIKETFDPLGKITPIKNDQLVCIDGTYYLGESAPPPPHPQNVPLDTWRTDAWKEIGQYVRYNHDVELLADAYLKKLFDVATLEQVPPFISVHVRRKDFADFKGFSYTPLDNYLEAVREVRREIQRRLSEVADLVERHPDSRKPPQHFAIPPSEYRVLATTDEERGSSFWRDMEDEGWLVVDHDALETAARYGEWYPAMIDGEILARGQGFVGTTWSTFSLLAGQRVEYWQGGVQFSAKPVEATRSI